jgi:beta-mannosidase
MVFRDMKHRFLLAVLVLFILVDGVTWWASYQAATAPSPEELAQRATDVAATPDSPVRAMGDGFALQIPLTGDCALCTGPWLYRQTGSEMSSPDTKGLAYFSPELETSRWRPINLPQNWFLAGLNYHGVIWFRREFMADSTWQGRAVSLRFTGVDYFADVWLNGQKLGAHTGYFQPFTFDAGNALNYTGRNVLVVRVESPYEEYGVAWPHRKTLIKGVLEHHNARPGGAWAAAGQEYNTGGIWNAVWLEISDFVTLDGVQLRATWPSTQTMAVATVDAQLSVNNHSDETVQASVQVDLVPRNFDGATFSLPARSVSLPPGETSVQLTGTVRDPKLWWTWDRGNPNLYTVNTVLTVDGQLIDSEKSIFGFRQITVDDDWAWTLNGQRFFPRGSTYISSQWLSQTDEAWFHRDVQLMRDANLNFVRVQAHVEPSEFYTAADELGLLVWQEFPLQWGYSDAPAFVDEAQRQLHDMITLLGNHPSIAIWVMHNESPWDTPALGSRMDKYDRRQNKRLDELLAERARRLDPSRPVHINSGTRDQHVYPGWESGSWRDYADLPGAPFVTEYGAQALPNLEMLRHMFAPEELTYQSGEVRTRWEFHDFEPLHAFDVAGIDPGQSTEEFIANSQAYQANLLQFATESYRRAKYDPMQGIVQYMFVDAWPAITWSVLDYNRQPKLAYSALKTAMQPILPSIAPALPARLDGTRWIYGAPDDVTAVFWVINDTLNSYPGARLDITVNAEAGDAPIFEISRPVDVTPDSSEPIFTLPRLDLVPDNYVLTVTLADAEGRRLGNNTWQFAVRPLQEATP